MSELDEKLKSLRSLRDEMSGAIKTKIVQLEQEKMETLTAYDEEIGGLQDELRLLGVVAPTNGVTDVGVKAYNYLLSQPGVPVGSQQLMQGIRSVGAVASVVLRPFLEDGRIKSIGEYRSTRYYVGELAEGGAQ